MFIMNQKGNGIVDTNAVHRITISIKEDAAVIMAGYDSAAAVTLGRYRDEKEAGETLGELFGALTGGQSGFYMPDSLLYAEERIKKDARAKRRGGS